MPLKVDIKDNFHSPSIVIGNKQIGTLFSLKLQSKLIFIDILLIN